jgi:hypothetical protein
VQEIKHFVSTMSVSTEATKLIEVCAEENQENLDLTGKQLETVPISDFDRNHTVYTALVRLALGNNILTKLPDEMTKFENLKYLNIKNNNLKRFPAVLCQLNLEILDISRNKITKLPNEFGSLMNLKVLNIAKNKLLFVPNYISRMGHLQILKLDGNPLKFPPEEVITRKPGEADEIWLKNLKEYLTYAESGDLENMIEKAEQLRGPNERVLGLIADVETKYLQFQVEFTTKPNEEFSLHYEVHKSIIFYSYSLIVSLRHLLLQTQDLPSEKKLVSVISRICVKLVELMVNAKEKTEGELDLFTQTLLETVSSVKSLFIFLKQEQSLASKKLMMDIYLVSCGVKECYELIQSYTYFRTKSVSSSSEVGSFQGPLDRASSAASIRGVGSNVDTSTSSLYEALCILSQNFTQTISLLESLEMKLTQNTAPLKKFLASFTTQENEENTRQFLQITDDKQLRKQSGFAVIEVTKFIRDLKIISETADFPRDLKSSLHSLATNAKFVARNLK